MKKSNTKGQNAIEYMLLFAVIVVVLMLALGPQGFFTQRVNTSIDMAVQGIEGMANRVNNLP